MTIYVVGLIFKISVTIMIFEGSSIGTDDKIRSGKGQDYEIF